MKKGILLIFLVLIVGAVGIISCRPINIFSPLVDPSKMGDDAKLDAGYNALASGDYEKAIDYFTDVINSASGNELIDAYVGRASAYLHTAAPNMDDVVTDLISGNIDPGSTGEIINTVVGDGELDDFFDNTQSAADDYNSAIDSAGSDIDPGILLEAYQANMMAATGVGAQKIADSYNGGNSSYADIWSVDSTNPLKVTTYGTVTLNMELDAIVASDRLTTDDLYHPYNTNSWENPTAADNGLNLYVKSDAVAKASMMGYLSSAYDALDQLKTNPPAGLSATDIDGMQTGIINWAYYGLDDSSLGTP